MEKFRKASGTDVKKIVSFIRTYVKKSGCSGVVLGISGGLDSAVAAKLAANALGPENVLGVIMPCGTPKEDIRIAKSFSRSVGIKTKIIDISETVERLSGKKATRVSRGNFAARVRMAVLYDCARRMNFLVVGTSNLSELMTGYFTKYGDSGCDIMPLAGYYKTQIYQMAEVLKIPEEIISKPPSAGFWEGQTDESELKMPYETLDSVLYLISKNKSLKYISDILDISVSDVSDVIKKTEKSEHKRKIPAKP